MRPPAVAGRFYPADPQECRRAAREMLERAPRHPVEAGAATVAAGGCGAIVPHAGWVCSGSIAAEAVRALCERVPQVDVVVVFGAIHTPVRVEFAALDAHDRWHVPGSDAAVALELGGRLTADHASLFAVEERLHAYEHAVEVEVPFLREAWPDAAILPVEVPLIDDAMEIGLRTARAVEASGARAVYLASSDLTHYGPAYQFAPAGVGQQGLDWARDNDQRLLDAVEDMTVERVVPIVRSHQNACGGGAVAAMLSACRHRGATRGRVLRHANSCETLKHVAPQPPVDAVGYAAVLIE